MEDFLVPMNKRKKKLSRKQRERCGKRTLLGVIALVALCVAAIGLTAFFNRLPSGSKYTYTTARDIWYLSESEMEIAAPAAK